MSANGIDLTTLAAIKAWLVTTANTDDQIIQDAITSFSAYVLRRTGRGPLDGTIPTSSPFVAPVAYDDFYDGTGTLRQPVRNWPITAVSAVNINGIAAPQSTSPQVPGWVVDGDKKFISFRGTGNPRGYGGFAGYGGWGANPRMQGCGIGFVNGIQNIEVVYTAGFSGVPYDLEMTARKVVSLYYKRRGYIGQRSQMMAAGAGTVSYFEDDMSPEDRAVLHYYSARVA